MKSYTDLEQSKKLAEILLLESADMGYIPSAEDDDGNTLYTAEFKSEIIFDEDSCIPCWSLAALLDIIPVTAEYNDMFVRLRIDKGHAGHAKYAIWYDDLQTNLSTDIDVEAENFIDACFEMIHKLNELKLL